MSTSTTTTRQRTTDGTRYGDKTAVDGLSFVAEPGVVTGFLGPNGAGKSTIMRVIAGIAMNWSSRRDASAVLATGGRPPLRTWRAWRRSISALSTLSAVAVVVLAGCSAGPGGTTAARQPGGPPPCSANPPPVAPPLHPTTVITIGQAYYCIFAHYYAGPVLDDRVCWPTRSPGSPRSLTSSGWTSRTPRCPR